MEREREVKVTVVVCTWNRARILGEALESLSRMRVPQGIDWGILVVDNGSTDRTADVARALAGRLPVERVVEKRPGLSAARNRALREAAGDYLLWLDDDVFVDPGWLTAYVDAFRRWPGAAVFGGPIRPLLEGRPPSWLVRCLPRVAYAYAALDLGPDPVPLGPSIDRYPYGGNFAVRTDAVGPRRFPEELGRRWGAHARGGEEIAFVGGILGDGHQGWWVPSAEIQHRIGPERQTTAYLRAYSAADAMSDEMERAGGSEHGPARSRLLVRWLVSEARYRVGRVTQPPDVWIRHLLAAGDARGRLRARTTRGRAGRGGTSPGAVHP